MKKETKGMIVTGVSTAILLGCLVGTIGLVDRQNDNNVRLLKETRSIRSTQEYIEAKHDYEKRILEAFQNGALSSKEYENKMNYASSDEYIYDNVDTITTESKANTIKTINEDRDKTEFLGGTMIVSALASTGGIVVGAIIGDKGKKKSNSGSIMSRYRYKDLEEENTL